MFNEIHRNRIPGLLGNWQLLEQAIGFMSLRLVAHANGAEVRFKFIVEAVPICEPYRLGSNFAKDRWFEVLECRTGEVRDGILNFCCTCSENFGAVSEVKHTLQEEGA